MDWKALDIPLYKVTGKIQVVCPVCSHERKKRFDKCVSVDIDKGVGYCHHCSTSFVKHKENTQMEASYKPVETKNFTSLTMEALQFFTNRGIGQSVVNKAGIKQESNIIVFPYFEHGQIVNTKKRAITEKKFFQSPNAKQVMYNYDNCKGQKEIIVCEGEMDALSFWQAGFEFVTSVSQGAPNEKDVNIDAKLACITNSFDMFEECEKIYIAVDKDANGKRLEKELIKRLGVERVYIVDFDFKDANEMLCKAGVDSLKQAIQDAKQPKIEGVFEAKDVESEILDLFRNGYNKGSKTYFDPIDEKGLWSWREGEFNIWTGYNNEGKTEFLLYLCMLKAYYEGRKFAIFSPENSPIADFFLQLAHSFIGKPSISSEHGAMTEQELNQAISFINKHFYFVYPSENFEIEEIFVRFRHLVRSKGVFACVIDPYNMVEHKFKGAREDLYISEFCTKLKRFAVENSVSLHLVAHQNKPQRLENQYAKPDLYNIKGGGTFADKVDNALYVWRPNRMLEPHDTYVEVGSQKIKKQRLVGKPNTCECRYDVQKGRYVTLYNVDMFENNKTNVSQITTFENECPF